MNLQKRLLVKPLILVGIAAVVFGYSWYRQKSAPDSVPEIESVKKLLRSKDPVTPAACTSAWGDAERALMKRKEYDSVLRLAKLMRDSGKIPEELHMLLDFSEYSAYFFGKRYPEALKKLDELAASGKLAPEVRGAVAGERMRCLAASQGIGKAMDFFRSFRNKKTTTPVVYEYACTTAVNLLFQYRKADDAYRLLLDSANVAPRDRKRHYLEQLGAFLARSQKDPLAKLRELMPKPEASAYFTTVMAMADEYAFRKQADKAEAVLDSLEKDQHLPRSFRNMASMKINILKEKKKK